MCSCDVVTQSAYGVLSCCKCEPRYNLYSTFFVTYKHEREFVILYRENFNAFYILSSSFFIDAIITNKFAATLNSI